MLLVVLSALLFGTISASAQRHVAAERLLAKKGLLIYTGALLTVHGRQTMLPLLSSSNVVTDSGTNPGDSVQCHTHAV